MGKARTSMSNQSKQKLLLASDAGKPKETEMAQIKRAANTENPEQELAALARANAALREELILMAHKLAEARHSAYHDELTGLPARSLFLDRLNQAMLHATRQRTQVALLLFHLDSFKEINEKFGQAAGDNILRQVAARISACIRNTDTACRYEADEFVIMLPEIDAAENSTDMAQKIRARLAAPYVVNDQIMTVTASLGMAIYRGDEQNCLDLIKQADVALSLAKVNVDSLCLQTLN